MLRKCQANSKHLQTPMRLSNILQDLTHTNGNDDKTIDFTAAGLYLPAVQSIFATTVSATVSILACWLIPVGAISAVRTLALTLSSGIVIIRKPIRIGNTKGINTIFSALRPCCFLYVMCLVVEQLVHTCVIDEISYEHGFWRRVIYHSSMSVLTIAAFLRSKSPRSESDLPFLVSIFAMLVVALFPPPAVALSGPLCSPPTLFGAGERVLRAFVFACVYTTLVYSAAPISNNLADTLVCIARSATASVWVLGSTIYLLPFATVQIFVILYFSFHHCQLQYEGVTTARDVEYGEPGKLNRTHCSSERDSGMVINIASDTCNNFQNGDDTDIIAAAAAVTQNGPSVVGIGPVIETINGGGLSFKLRLAANHINASNSSPLNSSSASLSETQIRMADGLNGGP